MYDRCRTKTKHKPLHDIDEILQKFALNTNQSFKSKKQKRYIKHLLKCIFLLHLLFCFYIISVAKCVAKLLNINKYLYIHVHVNNITRNHDH